MQNFKQSETRSKIAFLTKIEDVVGGCTLDVSDLPATGFIPEATIIGKDATTKLWHVMKSATAQAAVGNAVTAYPVLKNHTFKVGDIIGLSVGGKAVTITSIDTTNAAYDTINTDATIGTAVTLGQAFMHSTTAGATAGALPVYSRYAVTNNDVEIKTGDNHIVGAWMRATVKVANAPGYIAAVKALNPLILFV